nr:hypothetical protein [uncultured Allomuricauda sp.]
MFALLPILDQMESLYELPRDRGRFDAYLSLLKGTKKDDISLPIAGYNPMGKDMVLHKIRALKKLNAEQLIEEVTKEVNKELSNELPSEIKVALNLADDIGGSWSNKAPVDFSSKFLIEPLVKRNFCTPYVWTSEKITADTIRLRTKEYLFRTFYWIRYKRPKSLKDHLGQETFVAWKTAYNSYNVPLKLKEAKKFFIKNQDSQDYSLLFNFFYGDKASATLNYPTYGLSENLGFDFSRYLAKNKEFLGLNLDFFVE